MTFSREGGGANSKAAWKNPYYSLTGMRPMHQK